MLYMGNFNKMLTERDTPLTDTIRRLHSVHTEPIRVLDPAHICTRVLAFLLLYFFFLTVGLYFAHLFGESFTRVCTEYIKLFWTSLNILLVLLVVSCLINALRFVYSKLSTHDLSVHTLHVTQKIKSAKILPASFVFCVFFLFIFFPRMVAKLSYFPQGYNHLHRRCFIPHIVQETNTPRCI